MGGLWRALLFASQPLIWGHSFINSKDLPFMVFFLASIYFRLPNAGRFSKLKVEMANPSRDHFGIGDFHPGDRSLGWTSRFDLCQSSNSHERY